MCNHECTPDAAHARLRRSDPILLPLSTLTSFRSFVSLQRRTKQWLSRDGSSRDFKSPANLQACPQHRPHGASLNVPQHTYLVAER